MQFEIYGRRDPREVPAYTVGNAAYLLNMPATTLHKWVAGRRSRSQQNPDAAAIPAIIERPENSSSLSFTNLIEAHVLGAIRHRHGISLPRVRRAVEEVRRMIPNSRHPLAEQQFQTDGVDLFVEHLGEVVNVSRGGQFTIRALIEAYLQRIERDESGMPVRLFPFVREADDAQTLQEQPREIVIDPARAWGKPVISGTSVPIDVLVSRFRAGDEVNELADDFDLSLAQVNEVLRFAVRAQAA